MFYHNDGKKARSVLWDEFPLCSLFPRFFLMVGKGWGRIAPSLEIDDGRKAESAGGKRRFLDRR